MNLPNIYREEHKGDDLFINMDSLGQVELVDIKGNPTGVLIINEDGLFRKIPFNYSDRANMIVDHTERWDRQQAAKTLHQMLKEEKNG